MHNNLLYCFTFINSFEKEHIRKLDKKIALIYRNYSVKNEDSNFNVSGLAIFDNIKDKDEFLNKWSSKINSYNVDLDENF